MITRQVRTALRRKRQNKQCEYIELLKQGERAALMGLGPLDNPHPIGSEEHEIWNEGYWGE